MKFDKSFSLKKLKMNDKVDLYRNVICATAARIRKPATMVDEARSKIEDDADFHAVHIPAGFAFDLWAFASGKICELEAVDLGWIGGDVAAEYDAAQERGEVVGRAGGIRLIVAGRNQRNTAADIGIRRDEIHETRQIFEATMSLPPGQTGSFFQTRRKWVVQATTLLEPGNV